VDGRMPVVAAIKGVLFVHSNKGEICKPLSRFDVKLTCVLGGSTHREEQERGAEGQSHR